MRLAFIFSLVLFTCSMFSNALAQQQGGIPLVQGVAAGANTPAVKPRAEKSIPAPPAAKPNEDPSHDLRFRSAKPPEGDPAPPARSIDANAQKDLVDRMKGCCGTPAK